MSPLVLVIAVLILTGVCACVLASRADDYLDNAYAGSDPFDDDLPFDWPRP